MLRNHWLCFGTTSVFLFRRELWFVTLFSLPVLPALNPSRVAQGFSAVTHPAGLQCCCIRKSSKMPLPSAFPCCCVGGAESSVCPLHRGKCFAFVPGRSLVIKEGTSELLYWTDFTQLGELKNTLKQKSQRRWKLFYLYFVPPKF